MLHLALLPYHDKWADFFRNLETVVVDEVHTCRGVMGSHMAWVFRRLIRICEYYGSCPTFVFCSATIANPKELAESLTGLPVECVGGTGAPAPRKHFLLMDGVEGASRAAIDLLHAALHREFRTIVYCQSRKMTELIAMWAESRTGRFEGKISAYRAGFLPEERREIETRMAAGDLLAVVSTSALEMGIDIGALDLCILVGYPGTVMATWQRAGRVGRRDREAGIVLIGGEDALDQFMMRHPETFFSMPPETAVISPENPVIMGRHLVCAAAEFPLRPKERMRDETVNRTISSLLGLGVLLETGDASMILTGRKYPQRNVSLRGTGERMPILTDDGRTIGEIDRFRSFREAHPGAVYIHAGTHYLVRDLDLVAGKVTAIEEKVPYFTRPRADKDTEILEVWDTRTVHGTRIGFGRLKVTDQVTGFEKRRIKGNRSMGVTALDLPPLSFETEGIWIEVPRDIEAKLVEKRLHFMGGIHALEHAAIGILPLCVMCDRNDLGGISMPYNAQLGQAAVFVYDGFPGGIGLCRQAFDRAEEVLDRTLAAIVDCPCETGCPACVHSPKCGSGNRPIDKWASRVLLEEIIHGVPPSEPARLQPTPGDCTMEECEEDALRVLVLDLETRKSAEEVGGWNRAHLMEVSCVVVWDSLDDVFHTYLADEIPALIRHLKEADLVVGFNIQRFDYQVLSGYSGFDFAGLPTLDLLLRVRERLGYRLSLDHLGSETLKSVKSADGLQALKWWKEGKLEEIITYCRQDVALTRDLYLFGRKNGHLLFRNKAGHQVRLPVNFSKAGDAPGWGELFGVRR